MGGISFSHSFNDLKKKIIDGNVSFVDEWTNDTITVSPTMSAVVTVHGGNDTVVGNDLVQHIYDLPAANAQPIRNDDGTLTYPSGTGPSGDDYIRAQGGDDTIFAGDGRNTYDGGADSDTVNYMNANGAVRVDLAAGTGRGFGTDTLISIENASGSGYDDTLYGSSADNTLSGGDGNDVLDGRAGSDVLIGGEGDDWIIGGASNDHIDGSDGIDVASYANATTSVSVNLATGQGHLGNTTEVDYIANIEAVVGSKFADILVGNAEDNILIGLGGNDTLTGGAGQDRFVFTEKDLGTSPWQPDVITDFQSGEDIIDLSGLLGSNIVIAGSAPASDFALVDAFTGTAGDVVVTHGPNVTSIGVDLDGNRTADFTVRLTGLHELTQDDFWL